MPAHINRIQEIINEVLKTKRNVFIMGKNLQNIINKSIDEGYISFDKSRNGDLTNVMIKNCSCF